MAAEDMRASVQSLFLPTAPIRLGQPQRKSSPNCEQQEKRINR
jgi:hypothetical protein